MAAVIAVALVAFAYFLGSLPFGVWIARRRGVEIQEEGSGNTGATNVARVIGKVPGLITLVLDVSKGALPTLLAERWCGAYEVIALAGGAAILGHCFSPFLRGKGGKGVATALGVFLVISWPVAVVGMMVFLFVWRVTTIVALGSLSGMVAIAIGLTALRVPAFTQLGTLTLALLLWTHRQNLVKVFFA